MHFAFVTRRTPRSGRYGSGHSRIYVSGAGCGSQTSSDPCGSEQPLIPEPAARHGKRAHGSYDQAGEPSSEPTWNCRRVRPSFALRGALPLGAWNATRRNQGATVGLANA